MEVEVIGFEGEATKDRGDRIGLAIGEVHKLSGHLVFHNASISSSRKIRGGSSPEERSGYNSFLKKRGRDGLAKAQHGGDQRQKGRCRSKPTQRRARCSGGTI